MAIYLAATKFANDDLDKLLSEQFPNDVLRIADNQWLFAAPLTTQALSDKLDPGEGGKWGDWILVRLGNYSGWNDLETWDWIEQKRMEGRNG